MTQLRVSIIIPAYNTQATLPKTLASLQAQTNTAWEAIVVDDGSTDLTSEVAATFVAGDSRLRLVRQANAGESAARNAALVHATSDWLVFLDSDDWLLPTFLERMTS